MKTIAARLEQDAPQFNRGTGTEVIPLRDQFVGKVRFALWIILGAVGLVLLIACANVANLLLSRAAAREKEIAVRAALGAGRWRIVRQLLTESLLLAILGSLLGLALAWWGIKALVAISPRDLVNLQHVGLNLTVLAWTMGLSVITGIIFGLVPALEATRLDLNGALKEGKGTDGQNPRSRRLRNAFVITEVALALILLASAGLLVKSFNRLQNIDRGFNPDNLMTMVVRLPEAKYKDDQQMVSFFRRATERIRVASRRERRRDGQLSAALWRARSADRIHHRGPAGAAAERRAFNSRACYRRELFQHDGNPLCCVVATLQTAETSEARHVVLISESMARQHFPGEDPIGKRIIVPMSEKPVPTEIVGIVGDVRYESLVEEPEPTVYYAAS